MDHKNMALKIGTKILQKYTIFYKNKMVRGIIAFIVNQRTLLLIFIKDLNIKLSYNLKSKLKYKVKLKEFIILNKKPSLRTIRIRAKRRLR